MTPETLGISLAFIVMVTTMLWFIILGKGHWLVKLPLILGSIYISVSIWYSMNGLLGWPTPETLPETFQVYWVEINEPEAIYVWVKDTTKDEDDEVVLIPLHSYENSNAPRAYKLPYTKQGHEQAQGMKAQLMAGKPVFGTTKKPGGEGKEGEGEGEGEGKGQGREGEGGEGEGDGSLSQDQEPMFYELPPAKFLDKEGYAEEQYEF